MSFSDLLLLTIFQLLKLDAITIQPPSADLFSSSEFYPSIFNDISTEFFNNQVNHRRPPKPDLLSSQLSEEFQFPNISEDLVFLLQPEQGQNVLKPPSPALYNPILEGQFLKDIGDPQHKQKCSPETQVNISTSARLFMELIIQFKIAFAKTHKTGSSTMQNIFFR